MGHNMEGDIYDIYTKLESPEAKIVTKHWYPEALQHIVMKNGTKEFYIQSVNLQTEFVTVSNENGEYDTISFKQLKQQYQPVFTEELLGELIELLPTEYEGLKEKLMKLSLK